MEAKKAKELSTQALNNKVDELLSNIFKAIEDQTKEGLYRLRISLPLVPRDLVLNHLIKLGYSVKNSDSPQTEDGPRYLYDIDWDVMSYPKYSNKL